MQKNKLKKWKLLKSVDVSPSSWFPIERRVYEMPNGKIVDDFTVSTLENVAMVIPLTPEGEVVMGRQYKPGADQIMLEFPAGRKEARHRSIKDVARDELLEETGMEAEELIPYGSTFPMSTKSTEEVFFYLGTNVRVVSSQHLDDTEAIAVEYYSIDEVGQMIADGRIKNASTVAAWAIATAKFPEIFLNK